MLRPDRVIYRFRIADEIREHRTVGVLERGITYENIALGKPTPFIVVLERSTGPAELFTLDGLRLTVPLPWRIADASEVPGNVQEAFDQMVDELLDQITEAQAEARVVENWKRFKRLDIQAALHTSASFRQKMLDGVLAEIGRRGLRVPILRRS